MRGMTREEFLELRRLQAARGDHPGTYTCERCGRVATSANPIKGGLSCSWCGMEPGLPSQWMTWAPGEAPGAAPTK